MLRILFVLQALCQYNPVIETAHTCTVEWVDDPKGMVVAISNYGDEGTAVYCRPLNLAEAECVTVKSSGAK